MIRLSRGNATPSRRRRQAGKIPRFPRFGKGLRRFSRAWKKLAKFVQALESPAVKFSKDWKTTGAAFQSLEKMEAA
jgi:hypothetical protein